MIVRSELDPKFIFDELLKRDILIRDVSRYPMLQNFFRVSVGTPAENNSLLAALTEICESEKLMTTFVHATAKEGAL
jgi:histidinol-phosphate/aromatic aminotransferase/cobyric acid decarboxylase-like protein